jgi:biotin synthase-related radical SAM superfamily protein
LKAAGGEFIDTVALPFIVSVQPVATSVAIKVFTPELETIIDKEPPVPVKVFLGIPFE